MDNRRINFEDWFFEESDMPAHWENWLWEAWQASLDGEDFEGWFFDSDIPIGLEIQMWTAFNAAWQK